MNDLISVIINVYNGEKFIAKCLESVINQTYKNIEILIINDGSTDNTLEICKSYQDPRIRMINQENMGLSKARNVGIDNANGEYLYFVDVDDFIETDTIEYLYRLAKQYNALLSTCAAIDIHSYDDVVKSPKEKVCLKTEKEILINIFLSLDRSGTIWNKLIKKELLNQIRFEDRIINDVVVVYKLVIAAKEIVYSNQIKYYYLRHKNSITGKKEGNRSIDFYEASIERYHYIKNLYPNLKENEICLNHVIMNLYLENNTQVLKHLEEKDALKIYNTMFNFFNILFCKMKFREKIKLILFRINPKFCDWMIKKYLTTLKIKI